MPKVLGSIPGTTIIHEKTIVVVTVEVAEANKKRLPRESTPLSHENITLCTVVSTKGRGRKAYKVQFVDSMFCIYSALFYFINNLLKCDEVERISSKKLSKI